VIGTLERPGYRIKRRRIRPARIGKKHRISKEEAIKFISGKFGVQIKED
jgi:large subunit ribosomal protein L5